MPQAVLPRQRDSTTDGNELTRTSHTRAYSSWWKALEARKQDHGPSFRLLGIVRYLLTPLQLPIRELHHDTKIWGSEPEKLEPNRFVDNPKVSQSGSYRPWGGGHTLCPGRLFARRSVNAFVAILLTKYDVAVVSNAFPKADGARPSPGVVTVGQGEDLKLRLTPRKRS